MKFSGESSREPETRWEKAMQGRRKQVPKKGGKGQKGSSSNKDTSPGVRISTSMENRKKKKNNYVASKEKIFQMSIW